MHASFVLHLLISKQLIASICFRNFEHLIPDAPELIHDFLVNEKDASCKRNAFMMLIHADQVCGILSFSFCFDWTYCTNLQFIHMLMSYRIEHWIISALASTKFTLLATFSSWSLWS